MIATDNGSWRAPAYDNSSMCVDRLCPIKALDEYRPKPSEAGIDKGMNERMRLIVLCNWMSPGRDWSTHFFQPVKK